jgi:hypothetical protein
VSTAPACRRQRRCAAHRAKHQRECRLGCLALVGLLVDAAVIGHRPEEAVEANAVTPFETAWTRRWIDVENKVIVERETEGQARRIDRRRHNRQASESVQKLKRSGTFRCRSRVRRRVREPQVPVALDKYVVLSSELSLFVSQRRVGDPSRMWPALAEVDQRPRLGIADNPQDWIPDQRGRNLRDRSHGSSRTATCACGETRRGGAL